MHTVVLHKQVDMEVCQDIMSESQNWILHLSPSSFEIEAAKCRSCQLAWKYFRFLFLINKIYLHYCTCPIQQQIGLEFILGVGQLDFYYFNCLTCMHTKVMTGRDQVCFVVYMCVTARPHLSPYEFGFVVVWICHEWRMGMASSFREMCSG